MLAMTFLGYTITTFWLIALIILEVFIALWPASIASRKGYSFLLFFLISLFFWWITIFVAIFLPDKTRTVASAPIDAPEEE